MSFWSWLFGPPAPPAPVEPIPPPPADMRGSATLPKPAAGMPVSVVGDAPAGVNITRDLIERGFPRCAAP